MRRLSGNPLLLLCAFFYVGNTVVQHFYAVNNPFLKFYLNDLVCMPLVLGAAIFLQRYVVLRNPAYKLTKWQIITTTLYFAFMFEGIIPFVMARYTADALDVLAYFTGSWLFYTFGNAGPQGFIQKD